MGKTTLYHPVSLHVIRGALEYCGVKIGRLTQVSSTLADETALYRAVIIKTNSDFRKASLWELSKELQSCFSQDITVWGVQADFDVRKQAMVLTATFYVDIHEITPMERLLEDQSDEKMRDVQHATT